MVFLIREMRSAFEEQVGSRGHHGGGYAYQDKFDLRGFSFPEGRERYRGRGGWAAEVSRWALCGDHVDDYRIGNLFRTD